MLEPQNRILILYPHNTQNSRLLSSRHLCANAKEHLLPTGTGVLLLLIIHICCRFARTIWVFYLYKASRCKWPLFSVADHLFCLYFIFFPLNNQITPLIPLFVRSMWQRDSSFLLLQTNASIRESVQKRPGCETARRDCTAKQSTAEITSYGPYVHSDNGIWECCSEILAV